MSNETNATNSSEPAPVDDTKAGHEGAHGGHPKLGEFASTAICGNDITSSCLYVSALAIGAAGKLAPFALLIVAGLLFLFRSIYTEVVGALPLNGGAYNALLNTTSKSRASVAACLTILSYMATAVISAGEAMHYAHNLVHGVFPGFSVFWATIVLLGIFAGLTIMGISESASVAIGIFVTHLITLTVLLIVGLASIFLSEDGTATFKKNFADPLQISEEVESASDDHGPAETALAHATDPHAAGEASGGDAHDDAHAAPKTFTLKKISVATALFFGFSVALLGISGFESSSNFVEEQERDVFPKTLRNMWIAVSVFNPSMAFLALALVPIITIQQDDGVQFALLAEMGRRAGGGGWFGNLLAGVISIDAVLVLSGAVLTSFVGVNGLVRRMTLDRCMPQFLLKESSRGTTHRILIGFFLLSVSVHVITKGDIEALAGVYTISFLTVMALFAIGNILLKVKRDQLPRPVQASWVAVIIAISAVMIGLVGNAVRQPQYLVVFLSYFVPSMAVIALMLYRIPLLKLMLGVVRATTANLVGPLTATSKWVRDKIEEINSQQVVFFTRGDNVANLNSAMLYVSGNEDTNRIKVVTVVDDESDVPDRMKQDLQFLDEAYPEIDIEFVVMEGDFGPKLIQELSDKWNVPTNLMFIGSPGGKLVYGLAELGGVRLII
jgi:amino acid transporter